MRERETERQREGIFLVSKIKLIGIGEVVAYFCFIRSAAAAVLMADGLLQRILEYVFIKSVKIHGYKIMKFIVCPRVSPVLYYAMVD